MKKRTKKKIWNVVKISLIFIVKIPYYIVKYLFLGIKFLFKKTSDKIEEQKVEKSLKNISSKYDELKVVDTIKGDYETWKKKLLTSESQIGIILGSRGSGKTAVGVRLLENIYSKNHSKCFAMGFKKEEMPSWIKVVEDTSQIENNSYVLIDEGGILFSSRSSMSKMNKLLSSLILISRHKNINIIFISQNSSNLEVNVLRQADFLILKPSSLLQKDFERKIVQKIYLEKEKDFKKYKNEKGISYIHSEEFCGFVKNSLPSFWKETISKSFKNLS